MGKGARWTEVAIFDKGNNSRDNFALIDELKLKFVGSVKLDEHKNLAEVPNDDPRFVTCGRGLQGTKAFRVRKTVYGKERTVVVTCNQNLFDAQWRTVQNDLAKALEKLSALRQRLEDRRTGILSGGQAPTMASVEKQCREALRRQHLKALVGFTVEVETGPAAAEVRGEHESVGSAGEHLFGQEHPGQLISEEWSVEKIILAYRSQYLIEDVFKEMKDRRIGSSWPMYHWTDSKIRVHGLYCTIALLLRGLLLRRTRRAGIDISMKRLLRELPHNPRGDQSVPAKTRPARARQQTVLSKTNELQDCLLSILALQGPEKHGFRVTGPARNLFHYQEVTRTLYDNL